jgi:hypothetical protein
VWKTDLEKHDNQIQSQRKALLLLFSMMYVNWKICEIHNELLKNAFDLNVHEQRRMINFKIDLHLKKSMKLNWYQNATLTVIWIIEKNYHQARKTKKNDYLCLEVLYINDFFFLFTIDQSIKI